MKKLNSKAFSAVEGLLLVVLVALVAGVGYYVYMQQKDKDTNASQSSTTQTEQPAEKVVIPTAIPEGWEKQTYQDSGFVFYVPADWEKGKSELDHENYYSADYKAAPQSDDEAGGLGASTEGGQWLEVFTFDAKEESIADDYQALLAEVKSSVGSCGGDYYETEIAGQPAVIDDIKCHGTYETATLYFGSTQYMIRLNSTNEDNKENQELFKQILGTVSLEP